MCIHAHMGRSKWISGLFLKRHEIGGGTWKKCWGIGRAGGREWGTNVPRYIVYTYEIFKNEIIKLFLKMICAQKKTIPLSNTIPPKMSLCLQNQMVSEWLRPFLQNSSTNLTQDTSGNRAQLCVYKSNCIPSPEPTIWSLSSQLQHHVV